MTRKLSPRHRRTRLGSGVGRVAGVYEQCDRRPPSESSLRLRPEAHAGSLVVSGLFGLPCQFGHEMLRSLAGSDRLSDFDARTVLIADLLSAIRLDADADLIMWHGVDGVRIATPIARLFDDDGSVLLLGGPDQTGPPRWSDPVILRSSGLPSPGEMPVLALTAMTFAEFVGGER